MSPTTNLRWIFLIPMLVLASVSCSDRERLTGDGDEGDGEFTLGHRTVYTVGVEPGGTFADSVSGATFAFPAGGNGALTVARILESPIPPPMGADGYFVEFTGEVPVELRLERTAESIPLIWIYGFGDVSPSESMTRENTWWGIMPEDTLSNPAVFMLAPPGRPHDARGKLAGPRGSAEGAGSWGQPISGPTSAPPQPTNTYRIMVARVAPGSNPLSFQRNMRSVTEAVVQTVINGLPSHLRAHAISETSGRLKFRSYELMLAEDFSSYSAFVYPLGYLGVRYRWLYPMMHYVWTGPNAANEGTVAHEVGHYMTHVFFGDDAFEAFSDAQVRKTHEYGNPRSHRDMLEEYAMFTDFYINGTIRGGISPWEPLPQFARSPSIADFPAIEGYATALMTRMTTDMDSIQNIISDNEDIPKVQLTHEDIFGVLFGRKPTSVDALRAELQTVLAARNKLDRLPAVMERTGWSYNGTGQVRDKQGEPVGGAQVQSVCVVTSLGRDYLAPLTPVLTNENGYFTLDRIFPGTNVIRVKNGSNQEDFSYTINPNDPTNQERTLGTFTLGDSVLSQLRRTEFVDVAFEGEILYSDATGSTMLSSTTFWFEPVPPQWNGTTCTQSYNFGTPTEGKAVDLEATFSMDGRKIVFLEVTVEGRWPYLRNEGTFRMYNIDVSDINADEILYYREGADLERDLTITEDDQPTGQGVRYIWSINWESTETTPNITVRLAQSHALSRPGMPPERTASVDTGSR